MPRLTMDYNNTILYKIVCRDLAITSCYVGHTTNFTKRKYSHKQCCKTEPQYVYQFIRENGDWNNWVMLMIEQYPCNNLYEAGARERHWIETLNADLNQRVPPIALARAEIQKRYAIKNAEKIAEYQNRYRTENAEKHKQHYIKNRDIIAERHKQRVCCIQCKKELCYAYLATHCRKQH